ncbi:type II secretion system F family protein [Thermoflavimicrobium dichotomicum]|uniref:Tight adherence protein C n=1 Tax=Thermoflavimicrobium dichotomicum TaxID=46223 RepID=A0A1I3QRL2_9BACL|nr:type II secretion system F family protein [Thermoflavimicrobium dichotomicum]SFJ36525.1 tight adherence protein C [Thermoflavimicrobium dichotomicum]
MFLVLVLASWCCFLYSVICFFAFFRQREKYWQRLDQLIPHNECQNRRKEYIYFFIQLLDKLSNYGQKMKVLNNEMEWERDLLQSGYPYQLSVKRLHGARLLGGFTGCFIGLVYFLLGGPLDAFVVVFLPVLGLQTPIWFIRLSARQRQRQIYDELPNFFDLISMMLQAGISLENAFQFYMDTRNNPLSEELARVQQEIQLGMQREVAYRSLLKRVSIEEFQTFIQTLIHIYRLGTPLAGTLTKHAEELRRLRLERAKELAGKASPKISLVSALIMGPSIMFLMFSALVYSHFIAENVFRK